MSEKKQEEAIPPALMMLLQTLGGIKGAKGLLAPMMPKLETAMKEFLLNKKEEFKDVMTKGGYNTIGYSIVLMGENGLGVIFVAYDFTKGKQIRVSDPIGKPWRIKELVDALFDMAIKEE